MGLFALFCAAWQDFADAASQVESNGIYFETEKGYVGIHPAELVKDKAIKRITTLGDRLGIGIAKRKGLSPEDAGTKAEDQDPLVAYGRMKKQRS